MPKGGIENQIKTQGQRKLSGILRIASLTFFVLGAFLFPAASEAAIAGYTAEKTTQSYGSLALAPGKAITFEAAFKNTGAATWYNSSRNYISLYADSSSRIFRHIYWRTAEQPAKLLETSVRPGEIGHLKFALRAPEVLGFYTARFKLAAEDLTWIPGGILEIPINVTNNPTSSGQTPSSGSSGSVTASAENFQALKLIQSHTAVTLQAGGRVNFNVGFKNVGISGWEMSGANTVKICAVSGSQVDAFRDASWLETNCPAAVSSATLPNQIGYFSFVLQGRTEGDYNTKFILMNGDKAISGGEVIIPIKVIGSISVAPQPPVSLGVEPIIRIGLYSTTDVVSLRANSNFEVRDGNGNLIFTVPAGIIVYASFDFNTKKYAANLNGDLRSNLPYLRFVPQDANTIFEVTSFENRPAWNTSLNDNKFRGILELRYSEGRDKLYVINELPMEAYLKGLAESSNNNPIEYHKALATAARTYAQHNINIGGKHPAAYFTLNASAYDQVYRGYNSEIRVPNFVKAVEETRGIVVTYNGEVVVTPYFSQSDGRTRSWEEVWAGSPKPWLVSRPDPYCAGMTLWGHGVGFSARGAHGMAEAGNNFEQILKYYYMGVELKRIY